MTADTSGDFDFEAPVRSPRPSFDDSAVETAPAPQTRKPVAGADAELTARHAVTLERLAGMAAAYTLLLIELGIDEPERSRLVQHGHSAGVAAVFEAAATL